eukprot:7463702-Alexandrium_andersonii.AAC.1
MCIRDRLHRRPQSPRAGCATPAADASTQTRGSLAARLGASAVGCGPCRWASTTSRPSPLLWADAWAQAEGAGPRRGSL